MTTRQLFTHTGNKFVIGTLHGKPLEIVAQYNPKELTRNAAANWTPHKNTSAAYSPSGDSKIWMEYGSTEPRTLTVELTFDGYEEGVSIAPTVELLERLTIPVDMSDRIHQDRRRPQLCVAVWGAQQMRCVVMSVATKLTMFDETGEPLRAICSVTLKEVDVVAMMQVDTKKKQAEYANRKDQLQNLSGRLAHHERQIAPPRPPAAPQPAAPQPAAPQPATPKTVGTPSQQFNGDRDLDSLKQAGTPSQKFAGDADLDSPRQAPVKKWGPEDLE